MLVLAWQVILSPWILELELFDIPCPVFPAPWGLQELGQGWRLPGVNTKPLPWSWALGELLESRGDLEELQDFHQATVTQRGQAWDADRPQEGTALQEP